MCSEQRMAPFLPSEIARLVLGYLREEEGTREAATEFLNKSPHLGEIRATIKSGTLYTTDINNLSLKEILNAYCASCSNGSTKRPHDVSNGNSQQPPQSPPRLKVPRTSRGAPDYYMQEEPLDPPKTSFYKPYRSTRGRRPGSGRPRGSRGRGGAKRTGFGRWPQASSKLLTGTLEDIVHEHEHQQTPSPSEADISNGSLELQEVQEVDIVEHDSKQTLYINNSY